jgi:hypothetical protein
MNKKYISILIAIVLLGSLFLHSSLTTISISDSQTRTVYIHKSYLTFILALRKKSSFEKLLRSDTTNIISKNWNSFDFGLEERFNPTSWNLTANATYKLYITSEYLTDYITINQDIKINKNSLDILSKLEEQTGFIQDHTTHINALNESGPLVITISNNITYTRYVPYFLEDYIESKVKNYNSEFLSRMEEGLKGLSIIDFSDE